MPARPSPPARTAPSQLPCQPRWLAAATCLVAPAGACGYCGPDCVTPASFWPAEPEFGAASQDEQDGDGEDDSDSEYVNDGHSWFSSEGGGSEGGGSEGEPSVAPPAAHAALVDPAPLQAATPHGVLQQEQQHAQQQAQQHRKRRCDPGARAGGALLPLLALPCGGAAFLLLSPPSLCASLPLPLAAPQMPVWPRMLPPSPQRSQRQAPPLGATGAAGVAAAPAAAGGVAAAGMASPAAAHMQAARDILAAATLQPLQAAAGAAAAAEQRLQQATERLQGQLDSAATKACLLEHNQATIACVEAEHDWRLALSAYQSDLHLRLPCHLVVADNRRQAAAARRSGHGGRQRRVSAAAAAGADEEESSLGDEIEAAHEQFGFSMRARRLLDSPAPTALQRAAQRSDPMAFAAAAAAPQAPAPPPRGPMEVVQGTEEEDTLSALINGGFGDPTALCWSGGFGCDPAAAMRLQAQRAALPPAHQAAAQLSDVLGMLRELAGWCRQVMAWYEEAPAAVATWLAEHERRQAAAAAR